MNSSGQTAVVTACLALLLLGSTLACRADEGTSGGAAPYLREGVGARALGMGNAQVASGEDAGAAYWNPAALLNLQGGCLTSQLAVLGDNRSYNFINYCEASAEPVAGKYAYGLSWINFSAGNDIEVRTSNRPEPDSMISDQENTYLLSIATGLSQTLAGGVNLKILSQSLGDETAWGVGFDLALWERIADWTWGVTLQDVYTTLGWSGRHSDRLPLSARAGVLWQALPALRLAADLLLEYSNESQYVAGAGFRLGAEYHVFDPVALRAGLDNGRFTLGVGLGFTVDATLRARFDYALAGERLPGAGLSHLFSLVLDFPTVNSSTTGD